jgi:hypothetical protein
LERARARAEETHFEGVNGAGRDVDFEWLSGWRTDGLTGEALMRTLGEEAVSDKGISKVRLANDLNADAELSALSG